ncbi:hypothetical protein [Streptomyces sp. HUAS TT7]|uniref:hypothetical protein n=1 Tax=Streptomyces sp. HUAS TT7 TaxID=3447507 RepID=UPI003F6607C8
MNGNVRRVLLVLPEARVLKAVAALGLDAWLVRSAHQGVAVQGVAAERQLAGDADDVGALRTLLVETARAFGITEILYFGDLPGPRLAVGLALLELHPGHGRALEGLTDPAVRRRVLSQGGVSVVRAVRVSSVTAALAWSEGFPYPFAIKNGTGRGPGEVIGGRAQLEAWAQRPPRMPCVVEEHLAGPEVVVETFSHAGMHEMIGVSAVSGRVVGPGMEASPAGRLVAARSAVRALLDLVGLEFGFVRTRVVLAPVGPRIADVEVAGGSVPPTAGNGAGRDIVVDVLGVLAGRSPRGPWLLSN